MRRLHVLLFGTALVAACTPTTDTSTPDTTANSATLEAVGYLDVYPRELRQGDQLLFRAMCAYRSDTPLELWWLEGDSGRTRLGDPVPMTMVSPADAEAGDPLNYEATVDLPDWQAPGDYRAEFPCSGSMTDIVSWKVLPPWPTGTMTVSPLTPSHDDVIDVRLDCNVPMGDEIAWISLRRGDHARRSEHEIPPTRFDSHLYEATLNVPYWWEPGRYLVDGACPGPQPDDVYPGDPAPPELSPPPIAIDLVAPAGSRWDMWRPQAGPWVSPPPGSSTFPDPEVAGLIPPEGGSLTMTALCDGDIARDEGARFIGFARTVGPPDDYEDYWHIAEHPAERFIDADDGGVFIEATIEFHPDDPGFVEGADDFRFVALCTSTSPAFDPIYRDHPESPRPDVHVGIWLAKPDMPEPAIQVSTTSPQVGEDVGITLACGTEASEADVVIENAAGIVWQDSSGTHRADTHEFTATIPLSTEPDRYVVRGTCVDQSETYAYPSYSEATTAIEVLAD